MPNWRNSYGFCYASRMRGKISTLLAAGLLAISASQPTSAANGCRVQSPPIANVSFRFPPIVYERNKSRVQLTAESKGGSLEATSGSYHTAGLTTYRGGTRISARGFAAKQPNGTHCFVAQSVEVSVGYDMIKVGVDRKYNPGSCEYGAIFDHEERHVAVLKQSVLNDIDRLRSSLQAALPRVAAGQGRTPNGARDSVIRAIGSVIRPHLQSMAAHRKSANAALDTPESYRAVQAQCGNW